MILTISLESGYFVKDLVFFTKSLESGDFVKNLVIFRNSLEFGDFYEVSRIRWFSKKKTVIFKKSLESGDFVKNLVLFTKYLEIWDFYKISRIWWFLEIFFYEISRIWAFCEESGDFLNQQYMLQAKRLPCWSCRERWTTDLALITKNVRNQANEKTSLSGPAVQAT